MKKTFLVIGGVFTFGLCLILFHAMMFANAYGMSPLALFIGLAVLVIGSVQGFLWYQLGRSSHEKNYRGH